MNPADPLVKPIAAVLFREGKLCEECLALLEREFSPLDHKSPRHPFHQTEYYTEEMGSGLVRVLVSFTRLETPTFLIGAKHAAAEIEHRFREDHRRRVNVDMGYLDLFKVVLASGKERGQKIFLGEGVWADLTLTYAEGRFHPLPWSFPDFRGGQYDNDLLGIRGRYKIQLRELSAPQG